MVEYKKINGGDLGVIFLKRSSRTRRYMLHVDRGRVYATMPVGGTEREMLAFLYRQHDRLLRMLDKSPGRETLDESTELHFLTFGLRIIRNRRENYYSVVKDGILYISCPVQADFSDEKVQEILWGIVERMLRFEAKRVLPERLKMLARKHGFQYDSVKINNSRSQWGSCTSRKVINLSLSLMTLPEYLVDYILLHELCHTVEMNHSKNFWLLMNKVTKGKVKTYRAELKNCRML
ncbi:MAG: M48 family metallopeptidase [Tannerella sp.]|jgi:predicted metal-dependent hydrolase|nr:M48 family metallopeptidase [Tannerella sp.]